jgi:uncharacterized protein
MLIEFCVANFRSFHEEQVFSLIASKDAKHPDNVVKGKPFNLLKAAAVYGANASGKSNLIKAIRFMQWFVVHSATNMSLGDQIPLIPFRLTRKSVNQPSSFEATFFAHNVRFQYGFTATRQRVHEEWLIAFPHGRPQRWFHRRFNPRSKETAWSFKGPLKKDEKLLKEKTRDNGLVLSRGVELNIERLSPLHWWFLRRLRILDLSEPPTSNVSAKHYKEDPGFRNRVLDFVRHADLGIDDIRVVDGWPNLITETGSSDFLTSGTLSNTPISGSVADLSNSTAVVGSTSVSSGFRVPTFTVPLGPKVRTVHRLPSSDEEQEFDFETEESNGTQRFFALADTWLNALDLGMVLVIDELDCSIHPLLTRKLIEFFQSPAANKKGAQLVFATHDSTLLDSALFRRDQLWLVEKDQKMASRLVSLYDFDDRPRNNEALQRRYLAGRYGGVPVFGPTFEDIEYK